MPDLRTLRVQGMTIYWFRHFIQNDAFCRPIFSLNPSRYKNMIN